jgi:hypothetical protein
VRPACAARSDRSAWRSWPRGRPAALAARCARPTHGRAPAPVARRCGLATTPFRTRLHAAQPRGALMADGARQTYVSPEADRALCRAQGGNNSQGAIYRTQARAPLCSQSLHRCTRSAVAGWPALRWRPGSVHTPLDIDFHADRPEARAHRTAWACSSCRRCPRRPCRALALASDRAWPSARMCLAQAHTRPGRRLVRPPRVVEPPTGSLSQWCVCSGQATCKG